MQDDIEAVRYVYHPKQSSPFFIIRVLSCLHLESDESQKCLNNDNDDDLIKAITVWDEKQETRTNVTENTR